MRTLKGYSTTNPRNNKTTQTNIMLSLTSVVVEYFASAIHIVTVGHIGNYILWRNIYGCIGEVTLDCT